MYQAFDFEGGCAPSFERPIDLVHLARQTLGDRTLEREILDLFVTQVRSVLEQMEACGAEQTRADLAHTLKGTARAVGAWRVAAVAEECEAHVAHQEWCSHLAVLGAAVSEATGAIEVLRRAA